MSTQKRELYNLIENLPEELSNKVIDYVEYLKFIYTTNKYPSELSIKDEKDLIEKLEEGINDTENGDVCSIEEVFTEIEELLDD